MHEETHLSPDQERVRTQEFFTGSKNELRRVMKAKAAAAHDKGTLVELRQIRIGRNDPCPCGSGRKFKKCCIGKAKAAATEGESKT